MRRKKEFEERKKARQEAKAKKEREDALKKVASDLKNLDIDSDNDGEKDKFCYLLTLGEDAQNHIFNFCSARDLGVLSMTCRSINYSMAEARMYHVLSRLNTHNENVEQIGRLKAPINFCNSKEECRGLLHRALDEGGDTGRMVTKKSKDTKSTGDADEYMAYGRFLEEAVLGYSLLKIGKKSVVLVS